VTIHLTSDGAYSLAVDLGTAANIGPRVDVAVRNTALDVERDAKILAPVDTGNLRSSIGHTASSATGVSTAEVGPTAEYGAFVEFGTSRQAPQAYLGPALDRNEQPLLDVLQQLAGGAL
jgi:HK97 gp10 family phage protein